MRNQATMFIILAILAGLAVLFFVLGQEEEPVENGEQQDVEEEQEGSDTDDENNTSTDMDEETDLSSTGVNNEPEEADPGTSAPETTTVMFDESGFTPEEVTVVQGGTVTWENESSTDMWVASDVHPTHTVYAGTSLNEHCDGSTPAANAFDQCASGANYSFTFDQAGTWEYHNHLGPNAVGTVHVVE